MPRPEGIGKLAEARMINGGGVGPFETPMLVPSFSSKGFPNVSHIIKNTEPFIFGPILISAYDQSYGLLPDMLDFPELIFLDSGGYEAQVDADLSAYFDALNSEYKPKEWSEQKFEAVVKSFKPLPPVVHISYDHPNRRISISEQIDAALKFGGADAQLCREILVKPTTGDQSFLDIADVTAHVKKFSPFAIVGITEKELGHSLLDRMTSIAALRIAMQRAGLGSVPIHVFGSLDAFSTLLYFVMGADIFDGLTWLRYGYDEGRTIYRHEYAAHNLPASTITQNADEECIRSNYHYLRDLQLRMKAYVTTGDFKSFKFNSEKIEELAIDAWGKVG